MSIFCGEIILPFLFVSQKRKRHCYFPWELNVTMLIWKLFVPQRNCRHSRPSDLLGFAKSFLCFPGTRDQTQVGIRLNPESVVASQLRFVVLGWRKSEIRKTSPLRWYTARSVACDDVPRKDDTLGLPGTHYIINIFQCHGFISYWGHGNCWDTAPLVDPRMWMRTRDGRTSTSGGWARGLWGCRRKGMCLCFANCICTQSLSTTHRTEIWVEFSQSSSPPKEAFDFTNLINFVSHTNIHTYEEFLILKGQRRLGRNEPGIGCDVTHEIWSSQSIKWIPVPCAPSYRCVNVFCTVHPFVFSTVSSSSSHPPTRVAREMFQRNCYELCIEMFKASFDSLMSAVVRFVMLCVEERLREFTGSWPEQ